MINRTFFKKQTSNAHIRTMITSLIVRDLKIIKHKIDEYVIISIYVYDKDDVIKKSIRTCFIKEMHIIDDFKINIFIENDVDESESISIFLNNKTTHINNYKIIVSLKVKIIKIIIDKSVHLRKTTIISFKIELLIEIHHLAVQDRKYLFKLKKISNLTTYAHLINAFIKIILIRNEFNISIQIFCNYRLKRFTKMNYINAFHISNEKNNNIRELIAKRPQSFHQMNWFKKIITDVIIAFITIVVIFAP